MGYTCSETQTETPAAKTPSPRFGLGRERARAKAPFLFLYFSKTFFTEIYFQFYNLQFCTPTALRGAAGGLPPGRGAAGTYM